MANTFETTYASAAASNASISPDVGGPLRIAVAPEVQVRQLHATDPQTGFPRYVALRPKSSSGGVAQQWEALFYPTPEQASTLEYRHSVSPEPLSESNPYPLGGRQFAELLLESCLAVAEQRIGKGEGVATARFMSRLAAAIQLDIQSVRPTEDGVWPVGEIGTLSVNKSYLKRLIGIALDAGPHQSVWSHKQAQEVILVMETGLRKFYNPPLVGRSTRHEWTFLTPVSQFTTIADQTVYDLPEDFAMLHGPLTYAPGSNLIYPPIQVVAEYQIRQRLQQSSLSGRPTSAAVRPKPPDGSGVTRWELLLAPKPDDAYQINYRYRFHPGTLSDEAILPHGGPSHAQTVIEACLAAAEEFRGQQGLHSGMFMECLAASIAQDQKVSAPDTLGYAADRSDDIHGYRNPYGDWRDGVVSSPVTYNGNLY